MKLLEKWIPQAEKFTAQVKKVDSYIKKLEQENKAADRRIENDRTNTQNKLNAKDDELLKQRQEVWAFKEKTRRLEELLDRIPKDIREQHRIKKERGINR